MQNWPGLSSWPENQYLIYNVDISFEMKLQSAGAAGDHMVSIQPGFEGEDKYMHTVIKGTKTVAEFKAVQKRMEQLATQAFVSHKKTCDEWREGEIEKVWFDSDSNLCIEYQSGNCWHYNEQGEWW